MACLLLTLSVLPSDLQSDISAQQPNEVHVYAFQESSGYSGILNHCSTRSDLKVIFHNLSDQSSAETFIEIVGTLRLQGVEVTPRGLCLPCELYAGYFTWDSLWMAYASPLTGWFINGRLYAMTVGVVDDEILVQVDQMTNDDVRVFSYREVYTLTDESIRIHLEELLVGPEGKEKGELDGSTIVWSIIILALADSVNPCTFAVFTAVLFITLYSFGRMRMASRGFIFILAIFIGYFALGLGVIQILTEVPNIHRPLAIVGIVIGAFSIVTGAKPEFRSPIPKSVRRFIEQLVSRSYLSSAASFVLGVILAFTLLPCTGGPYLVGLGLLSSLKDPIEALLILALYNIIFTIPLVAILISLLAFGSLSRKLKAFRSTRLGLMEIISGSLLLIVCAWILIS